MKNTIIILFLLAAIIACQKKKPNKPSWDVEVIIPILNVKFEANQLLGDSSTIVDADQSLGIVFEDSIFSFNFDSLVRLPDELFKGSIPFPILTPTSFEPGEQILVPPFAFDQYLELDDGIKIETVKVKSGEVHFDVLNKSGGDIVLSYELNSSQDANGNPLTFSNTIVKDVWSYNTYSLDGYTFDLRGLYQDTVNTIRSTIGAYLSETEPGPVIYSLDDTLEINIYFENMVFEYGFGYFGQKEMEMTDQSIDIGIFDNFSGNFEVPSAQITLRAINEYGIDGKFHIQDFTAYNSTTNESLSLTGAVLDSNFYFGRAVEEQQLTHQITKDTSYWDFSQSNILNLFGILPDHLSFSADIQSNISGDSIHRNNFFYKGDEIALHFRAEVTQGFKINDILQADTIVFTMDEQQYEKIDSLRNPVLNLVILNHFPFEIDFDIIFLNEDYIALDTLVDNFRIEAPLINEKYFAIESKKSVLSIIPDDTFVESLKKTAYIVYQSRLSSAGDSYVKLHYRDQVKIILNIETEYEINTNSL
jgi:hypothetical protein